MNKNLFVASLIFTVLPLAACDSSSQVEQRDRAPIEKADEECVYDDGEAC